MLADDLAAGIYGILKTQRSKFRDLVTNRLSAEKWLQAELGKLQDLKVTREFPYPKNELGQRHVDFWRREDGIIESWVELKTCITNYQRQFGIAKQKNITNQISWIISDIEKLRSLRIKRAQKACLFIAYPLYANHHEHDKWQQHLARIREISPVRDLFETSVFFNGKSTTAVTYLILV